MRSPHVPPEADALFIPNKKSDEYERRAAMVTGERTSLSRENAPQGKRPSSTSLKGDPLTVSDIGELPFGLGKSNLLRQPKKDKLGNDNSNKW